MSPSHRICHYPIVQQGLKCLSHIHGWLLLGVVPCHLTQELQLLWVQGYNVLLFLNDRVYILSSYLLSPIYFLYSLQWSFFFRLRCDGLNVLSRVKTPTITYFYHLGLSCVSALVTIYCKGHSTNEGSGKHWSAGISKHLESNLMLCSFS